MLSCFIGKKRTLRKYLLQILAYLNTKSILIITCVHTIVSQLFREKKIFKYWSYNGVVNIMESDGQRPRKILHVLDIDHLFDDHLESANDEFSSESVADFSSAL